MCCRTESRRAATSLGFVIQVVVALLLYQLSESILSKIDGTYCSLVTLDYQSLVNFKAK